jgi:pimeloyl-ACP methyl ester carboxylesterase
MNSSTQTTPTQSSVLFVRPVAERDKPTVETPPPLFLFLFELRVFIELIQVAFIRFLTLPKSDGRTVIVYPGLAARDWMTWPLRFALKRAGYKVYGWGLGMNRGPRTGVIESCDAKIKQCFDECGRPVTLIGWSLGGLMARELAKRNRHYVRDVITMGSPFSGSPRANYAWGLYQALAGETITTAYERFDLYSPPQCPTMSIYSRTDGIVHTFGCRQPAPTHVAHAEVNCSHLALTSSFAAIRAVGDRMAIPLYDLAAAKVASTE